MSKRSKQNKETHLKQLDEAINELYVKHYNIFLNHTSGPMSEQERLLLEEIECDIVKLEAEELELLCKTKNK